MPVLARPDPSEYAPYYGPYVDAVAEDDLLDLLRRQPEDFRTVLQRVGEARGDHRYAPGKWTVRQVAGHVIDTERVFAYRTLRISRKDPTPLPGFDQELFVAHDRRAGLPLADLADAFARLRASNMDLFEHLDEAMLERTGTASGQPVSVRALLYITAGHVRHHARILEERYLPPD